MNDTSDSESALGVLQLQNTPMTFLGCLGNPRTFRHPVRYRFVSDAWVSNVVAGDSSVAPAFVDAARALEGEGVAAITSNCGFAIRCQAAIAASVGVPVSTSSLVLLPSILAMLPPEGVIGILTFDARHFSPDLLELAGVLDPNRVAVQGIEDSESWRRMSEPKVDMTLDRLLRDVLAAIDRLRASHPRTRAILFECAGFGPVSAAARRRTGLPVFDAVTNADLLMAGARAMADRVPA